MLTYSNIFYHTAGIKVRVDGRYIPLKTYFRDELKKAQLQGLTKIGVVLVTNSETGITTKTYKSLDDVSPICKKKILNNEYLYIDSDRITSFTNDPKEPSYAYMGLSNLIRKDVYPQDWFWFEEQISPDLVDMFRAYIYSLFVAENTSRQMLVLYGPGQTGKSTIMNALSLFFDRNNKSSDLVVPASPSSFGTEFFTSTLLGKRVMRLDDSDNPQIHTYTLVKKITGGDAIPINIKFGPMFRKTLNLKIIASLNCKLNLDITKKEEFSRVILIPVTPQKMRMY